MSLKRIKIWNDSPSREQLAEIGKTIDSGGLAVIPTDTLYAVVCDALAPKAIERLCRLKGINPEKTNLSIICSDISMAAEYARFNNSDFRLIKDYTPGPFTFLFKSASSLPKAFKGRKTVGIRIPDNTLCRELAAYLNRPLLTTSIEFEDDDYGTHPDLIAEAYDGKADLFVEGESGETIPSTIVDCTGDAPEIVRQGKGEILTE